MKRIILLAPCALWLVLGTAAAQTVTPSAAGPTAARASQPAAPTLSSARPSGTPAAVAPAPPASTAPVPPAPPAPPASVAVAPQPAVSAVPPPSPVPTQSATAPPAAAAPVVSSAPLPWAPASSGPATASGLPGAASGAAPLFVAPAFNPAAAEKVSPQAAFEPGQLLVLWLSDEAAAPGLSTLQQRYQLRPRQRYSLGNLGFVVAMFALPGEPEAQAMRQRLRAEQPQWIVDLNARSLPLQAPAVAGNVPPRLYAQQMLGGANLNAPRVPSFRLGVVDTGVDAALTQPIALNGSLITQRSVLGPADKAADTAHGTAILQLLAGVSQSNGFAGSAPPVQLAWVAAMRELNGKPATNSLALALALDWLLGQQVSLINMSLGGQGDEILKAVVNRVLAKNVVLVAAAGNRPGSDAPPVYPAAYPGVWAVTAVDAAGQLHAQASRAGYVTLAAPGVELWVPAAGGQGRYVSGTSYAAALASAALAWQAPRFWALSAPQRRQEVCAQARKAEMSSLPGCGLVQKNSSGT